jgi:uncharacterized protein YecT (DUF1311 family)
MAKLSRNQKKVLLDGQRAWIILRKTNCELFCQHAGGKDGGSAARLEFSGCSLTMTAARAKELVWRVRASPPIAAKKMLCALIREPRG